MFRRNATTVKYVAYLIEELNADSVPDFIVYMRTDIYLIEIPRVPTRFNNAVA